MSLDNLSPTAIKIGLAIPFLFLAAGIYAVIHGIQLPPAQLGFWLIGTIGIAYGGVAVIRKMSQNKGTLWLVFFGFMAIHFSISGMQWGHFSRIGGIYIAGAAIAELYFLTWLLTWVAIRPRMIRDHGRGGGKRGTPDTD